MVGYEFKTKISKVLSVFDITNEMLNRNFNTLIDIDTREILENALIEFDGTILFISHDRHFINKVATHIIEIKNKN